MMCSCLNEVKKGEPRHCGNAKEDWFSESLLISPFDPACETKFNFTGDGRINPSQPNDHAAIQTIIKLRLDIPKLRAMRSQVIEPFLDEMLSPLELQAFVSGYLSRDDQGKYGEFWTTIRQLFGALAR